MFADDRDVFNRANAARAKALLADLAVGLTLVKLALDGAPGSDKRLRNQHNARKAYDSVVSSRNGVTFSPAEERAMDDGLAKLRSALQKLGDSIGK